ncbi:Putative oxidoreductase [Mycobacterium canettii CIPT 140070017]|nr:Putative oxidoreductase [Mycobacterium canettii CIPT 140070017]
MTDIEVALPFWLDRPDHEATDVALAAADTGFAALWIGEMATYDAFALATSIGLRAPNMTLKVGPLAVGVRGPVGLALGVSSVASLTGCRVDLALGASSPAIVAGWHGRPWAHHVPVMRETIECLRSIFTVRGSNTAAVTSTAADSGCAVRHPIRELRWGRLDLA